MILMYHKVDVITPTIWWVTPEDLARRLDAMRERDFVYLDDYTSPETQVVITFDDAYENVARHGLPTLRSRRVPFEVFVIGDVVSGWNTFDPGEPPTRHMSWAHLEDVVASGGRLQWHSRSHAHLPDRSDAEVEAELTVTDELRLRFPSPHFRWFAYPGGAHDERSVAAARRLFAGAVSVIEGQPGDRWQLNRVTVDRDTALPLLGSADLRGLACG